MWDLDGLCVVAAYCDGLLSHERSEIARPLRALAFGKCNAGTSSQFAATTVIFRTIRCNHSNPQLAPLLSKGQSTEAFGNLEGAQFSTCLC